MEEDSVMRKIRRIREQFYDECGGDVEKMAERLIQTEQKWRLEKEKLLKEGLPPQKKKRAAGSGKK